MRTAIIVCAALVCVNGAMAKESIMIEAETQTVIEAENYSKQVSPDSHAWKKIKGERKDIPTHILAAPSANTVYDVKKRHFEKLSPCVSYALNFVEKGTYYVWIRGLGEAGGASVAVGLDGALLKSDFIGFFGHKWGWLGSFRDGDRVKLVINKPGEHTLGLWMVEDGVRIDRLLITDDPGDDPNTAQIAEQAGQNQEEKNR